MLLSILKAIYLGIIVNINKAKSKMQMGGGGARSDIIMSIKRGEIYSTIHITRIVGVVNIYYLAFAFDAYLDFLPSIIVMKVPLFAVPT